MVLFTTDSHRVTISQKQQQMFRLKQSALKGTSTQPRLSNEATDRIVAPKQLRFSHHRQGW